MKKNIKILITYHDEHPALKSDILTPIQTGCANAERLFDGMLRDNDGENISAENSKYNELSAQYWAWKNYDKLGNPDYIGFMHYRRHFMFDGWRGNPDQVWLPKGAVYKVSFMSARYMRHIKDKYIQKQLKNNDVLIIKPFDVRYLQRPDLRTQYGRLPQQNIKNFDIFIKTAKKIAPDYLYEIEMIEKGSIQCLCNMFVMPKALFFEYNQFIFPILAETDSQIDKSNMDEKALRYLGYFGEFLMSVFVFHIHRKGSCRIKELNASYILCDRIVLHPYYDLVRYYILYKLSMGNIRKRYKLKFKELKRLLKK